MSDDYDDDVPEVDDQDLTRGEELALAIIGAPLIGGLFLYAIATWLPSWWEEMSTRICMFLGCIIGCALCLRDALKKK